MRTDILGALSAIGYVHRTVGTLEEIFEIAGQDGLGLLIVDASSGEAEASQRVIEMSAASAISHIPIVFISYQASKRSAILKKSFPLFIPIDIPFRLAALLERLVQLYPLPAAPPPPVPSGEVRAPVRERKEPKILSPDQLISPFGGLILALGSEPSNFNDELLLPDHPSREKVLSGLKEISDRDAWLGIHSRRVAMVSSAVAKQLELSKERDASVRVAAMFLNWALKDRSNYYASFDLFLDPEAKIISLLASSFAESADYIHSELGDEVAADTVRLVSSLMQDGSVQPNSQHLLGAHCVLATELADRACWGLNMWDNFGAHRAVRKLWRGEPMRFELAVIAAMNRTLTEAAIARYETAPPEVVVAEDDPDAKLIREANREADEMFRGAKRENLQLTDLKPGMRLAQPVITRDGRLICRANISLDRDIIWRIWQLATIRPIRVPVAVLSADMPHK